MPRYVGRQRKHGGEILGETGGGDRHLVPARCDRQRRAAAVEIVGHYRAFLDFQAKSRLDVFRRDLEQLLGKWDQFVDRKTAMPVVHSLRERI